VSSDALLFLEDIEKSCDRGSSWALSSEEAIAVGGLSRLETARPIVVSERVVVKVWAVSTDRCAITRSSILSRGE
jgi:hypothetical protein